MVAGGQVRVPLRGRDDDDAAYPSSRVLAPSPLAGKQVRERYINHLDSAINHGPFTATEDRLIYRCALAAGCSRAKGCSSLPTLRSRHFDHAAVAITLASLARLLQLPQHDGHQVGGDRQVPPWPVGCAAVCIFGRCCVSRGSPCHIPIVRPLSPRRRLLSQHRERGEEPMVRRDAQGGQLHPNDEDGAIY